MKKTIIITSILLFVGCSAVSNTTPYNTPFINADETIQLYEGMTKNDVLNKVGHPLYVKSGINNTIVWIYEVRSIEVQSETEAITQKVILKKSNSNKRNSDPIHRMEIVFINNKVDKWGMIVKEQKVSPKKEKPKPENKVDKKDKNKKKTNKKDKSKKKTNKKDSKKKSSWALSPSLWTVSTHEDMGFGIGFSVMKGNFGFELNHNWTTMEEEEEYGVRTVHFSSTNSLFLYNKNYENFTTQFGIGQTVITSTLDGPGNNLGEMMYSDTGKDEANVELFLRMAIGKHLSYKNINFTPMLEMNYFNEEVGFSLMTRFNF